MDSWFEMTQAVKATKTNPECNVGKTMSESDVSAECDAASECHRTVDCHVSDKCDVNSESHVSDADEILTEYDIAEQEHAAANANSDSIYELSTNPTTGSLFLVDQQKSTSYCVLI